MMYNELTAAKEIFDCLRANKQLQPTLVDYLQSYDFRKQDWYFAWNQMVDRIETIRKADGNITACNETLFDIAQEFH